jgi:SAM-dependent methyltransferase
MKKDAQMKFSNIYEDSQRARAYATLKFEKTYYLAYRDIPKIISEHVSGKNALDFGCGTGRSTRFLQSLGFNTVGIDISEEMITIAQQLDPTGEYHHIVDGDFRRLPPSSFDLIFSTFTFDNIPTKNKKIILFKSLSMLIKQNHQRYTPMNGHRLPQRTSRTTQRQKVAISFASLRPISKIPDPVMIFSAL